MRQLLGQRARRRDHGGHRQHREDLGERRLPPPEFSHQERAGNAAEAGESQHP